MKHNLSLIAICILLAAGCSEKPADTDGGTGTILSVPELPSDSRPESTSFNHRILLLQHTGTYCPNCPALMKSLRKLAEDEDYAEKYHHVASHSYNESGDPAYSQAAKNLSQVFCSGYYPELTFNLTAESTGTSIAVETIREEIDARHKEMTDVGICAASAVAEGNINVNVGVKSAKGGEFRIAVWLLEDGIRARQEGAGEDWMHTHGNAVRDMAGKTVNNRIYGEKVNLEAGKTAGFPFAIPLDKTWKAENCKVIILVNAATSEGKYDLVNCALCPADGTLEYDYKN